MSHLEKLPAQLRQEVEPLLQRWPTFVQKLSARVDEALAEAAQGLDGLIEQHAAAMGPMGAAMGAVKSRFHGLEQKLEEAREKVDEALWEIIFRDGVDSKVQDVVGVIRDEFLAEASSIQEELGARVEALETEKRAAWARRLQQVSREEIQQGVPCSNCAAPFQVQVYWRSNNENCPYCQAMNTVSPGPASSALYQGGGVQALAHEAAAEAWRKLQRAEARFNALRNRSERDRQVTIEAARRYWTIYYQTVASLDPGFDGDLEGAVAGRLRNYTFYDSGADKQGWAYLDRVLEAAGRRDETALRALMSGERPHSVWGLDDVCDAIAERGDLEGAKLALGIRYELEGPSEPRDAWMRAHLDGMRGFARTS
jgi:hypothetical protein